MLCLTCYPSQRKPKKTRERHPLFDPCNHITIEHPPLQNPKSRYSQRVDQTPAIRQHPHGPNLKHGSKIHPGPRRGRFRWHDHSESRSRQLQAAPQHQSVPNHCFPSAETVDDNKKLSLPWFKKVQIRWDAREGELAYEQGCVQPRVPFFLFDGLLAFGVQLRKSFIL